MNNFEQIEKEMALELQNILNYWSTYAIDKKNDGFVGERNFYNKVVPKSNKGIILNSRILWSFSAASNHLKTTKYTQTCQRAFEYIHTFFKDEKFGGTYWELCSKGMPINKRKQVYAQAFTIYALAEYFIFSKNEDVLNWAIDIFHLIEKHAKDKVNNGYIEAFNENWSPIEDMRLSDKDQNDAKTMNTHLHVLEAYTTLLKVYKNEELKNSLTNLINLFLDKFLKPNGHLKLFFDEKWNSKSTLVSYGHDIETAWLLIEAAKEVGDEKLLQKTNEIALLIANTFIEEGIDETGGVLYEFDPDTNILDTDKHWWPQAEAIVGLKYAYSISKQEKYVKTAKAIWDFTKAYIIDKENGEWFWRVDKNGNPNTSDCKMGMWKAPYHNSRACLVINS